MDTENNHDAPRTDQEKCEEWRSEADIHSNMSAAAMNEDDKRTGDLACGSHLHDKDLTADGPDEKQPLKPLESDEDSQPPHIDRGWAWMIVLGCCMMHLLVGGFSRSYGIIYIYLMERFGGSAAVTAWVGGACSALRMAGSPISTALVHRFSTRSVVFFGALLLGCGLILSAFTPNTEFLFFSISFMAGFGGALVYSPAVVIVGQYFNKYRSIAIGLATAGSGLGIFAFPPLMDYLFRAYSYSGAMLIMGALLLNNCVSALLYRPPVSQPISVTKTNVPATETYPDKDKSDRRNKHNMIILKLDKGLSNSSKNLAASYSPALHRANKPDKPNVDNMAKSSALKAQSSKTCDMTNFYKYLDLRLFKNKTFVCYTSSLTLITLSYVSGQMLIPPFALERNVSKVETMWLLSVIGLTDTIGRILVGFVFNIAAVRPHRRHYYSIAMVLSGVTHVLWSVSHGFTMFVVVSAFHGLITGAIVSQRAVICIDLMGIEILPSSFGLSVFMQGLGVLIGPAVAGLFRDLTGTFFYSYIFTAFAAFLSAFFLFAEWLFIARKSSKKEHAMAKKSGECEHI